MLPRPGVDSACTLLRRSSRTSDLLGGAAGRFGDSLKALRSPLLLNAGLPRAGALAIPDRADRALPSCLFATAEVDSKREVDAIGTVQLQRKHSFGSCTMACLDMKCEFAI